MTRDSILPLLTVLIPAACAGASMLIAEKRKKALAVTAVAGAGLSLLAALIGYLVVPASPDGWRWALAVGIVPTLYAVVIRYGLPESVRFLEARGRHEEAEAAVRRFESSAGIETPAVDPGLDTGLDTGPQQPSGPVTPVGAVGSGTLWNREYGRRTAALWAVWFMVNLSYYGAFIWLPTLIAAQGYSLVKSMEYTLIITLAQLPGYALAAWLIEVWGRRATLATFLLGSAVSAGAFGFAHGPTYLIVVGMCLSFFNLGAWGALYAVSPEIYPTAIRATGTGAAAAFGRIASIIAPLSVPVMLGIGGQVLVFAVFGGAFAMAALAALALPEFKDKALDETV